MDGEAAVTIALQQIVQTQQQMQSDVSAMRAEVGKAITRMEVIDGWRATANQIHTDQEARIRLLERFRYTLAGIAVVAGLIEGVIGYWLGHVIR